MRWYQRVLQSTQALVQTPSISPYDDDPNASQRCADVIAQLLMKPYDDGQVPLFDVQQVPISASDPRRNVFCLLRGEAPTVTQRTIILLGHYDTVGVDTFADASLAFDPERLRQHILQRTVTDTHSRLADAQKDAQETVEINGETLPAWLFGRGALDMKSGIAINIELLRALWRERHQLKGHVLLVATPDEETDSAGMLEAVTQLLAMREREKLEYVGTINVDYTTARNDQTHERYIYTGTIGKLLPTFYVIGEQTHVGEPFRGVDANLIVSELVRAISLDSALCDVWSNGLGEREVCVPPIVLNSRDLKMLYNVQTSAEAFVFINWLTYTYSPEQALRRLKAKAQQALHNALAHVYHQFQQFQSIGGMEVQTRTLETLAPHIYTFSDLRTLWLAQHHATEADFTAWVRQQLSALDVDFATIVQQLGGQRTHQLQEWGLLYSINENALDDREKCGILVKNLVKELPNLQHPAVIIYFSPPFYPHHVPTHHPLSTAVKQVVAHFPMERGEQMHILGFYPYISDMSFLQMDAKVFDELHHIPMMASDTFALSEAKLKEIARLNTPSINIGPYGKEAHGQYERVYTPYSFETVPQLIYQTIYQTFNMPSLTTR